MVPHPVAFRILDGKFDAGPFEVAVLEIVAVQRTQFFFARHAVALGGVKFTAREILEASLLCP